MKKVIALGCIGIIGILMFAGCSKNKDVTNYNYSFYDENDLWEAELKVEGSTTFYTNDKGALDVDSHFDDALIAVYKGDIQDLEGIRHVKISYSGALMGGSLETEYDEGEHINSKVFKLAGGGSGSTQPEDDVITVTIQIDDWAIQTLELTTAKNKFETY